MREPGFWSIEDGRAAREMAESMVAEGWVATWCQSPSGGWRAEVHGPGSAGRSVGRGSSRFSAIVDAQLAVVRRLGREPWPCEMVEPLRLDVAIRTGCLILN